MYFFYKSMHLISMVTWFAGLFYMFRLYVYHVENKDKPDAINMLKVMERKLYYYITTPGMVLTLIFGTLLIFEVPNYATQLWFKVKILMIFLLAGYHHYIGYTLKRFKNDDIYLTSKQCRMLNEFPTLFLIGIIFSAVYKYI